MDQPNTLEAFIEHLHAEGVEAGRQAADRLREEAVARAAEVVEHAKKTARELTEQAQAQAAAILAAAQSELDLAVRDAQLELRARLERALTLLLEEGIARKLDEPALLTRLLTEVVQAHAGSESEGQTLEIRVRPESVQELAAAVPGMLGRALADGTGSFDLNGSLRTGGFECRIGKAVVEVTPESVAEKLAQLVSPQLRAVLRDAAAGAKPAVPER